MTDQQSPNPKRSDPVGGWTSPGADNVKLVYFLYLASLVLGVSAIVGVVFAYINRGKSDDWIETHYTYQIRTFWIGILYTIVAIVLTFVLIGFLVLIAVLIWYVVRVVLGLQRASQSEPVKNPRSWLI